MINVYALKIKCIDNNLQKLSNILNWDDFKKLKWKFKIELDNKIFSIEVTEEENDPYFDYINFFLDIIEDKYELLEKIWIKKEYISIWRLYKYDNQCNMEWSAKDLKRLWDNWITLCASCWEIENIE